MISLVFISVPYSLMQSVYGEFLKAVQSFYIDSRAYARMGNYVSGWFPVNVRLRQGRAMSTWLSNVYMER